LQPITFLQNQQLPIVEYLKNVNISEDKEENDFLRERKKTFEYLRKGVLMEKRNFKIFILEMIMKTLGRKVSRGCRKSSGRIYK
jgi:hypothetical protein